MPSSPYANGVRGRYVGSRTLRDCGRSDARRGEGRLGAAWGGVGRRESRGRVEERQEGPKVQETSQTQADDMTALGIV